MQLLPPSLRELTNERIVRVVRQVAAGRACHLVGGALRDRYLALENPDFDLVVAGGGRPFAAELAERLGGRLVLLGGDRFSAYRIVSQELKVDLWDRGRSSLDDDLERRDFTVNAMALDIETGAVHDPFGGLVDLQKRRLRVVGGQSFLEDPLRVLRLVRFSLFLPGFSVEATTTQLARNAAASVPATAAERRRDELARITTQASAKSAFDALAEVEVLPLLWSGDSSFPAKSAALSRRFAACDAVATLAKRFAKRPVDKSLCFHALIGQAIDGQIAVAEEPSARWRRGASVFSDPAGLLSSRQLRSVRRLLRATRADLSLAPRQFLARWSELWLEAAALVLAQDQRPSSDETTAWLRDLGALVEAEGPGVLAPRPVLDGSEIGEILGLPPGPVIGRLLSLLVDAQVRGEVRDREEAVRLLPELMQEIES